MTPTRRSNTSQLDAEAQGDPDERWRKAAGEILEQINAKGPQSPERRAYDQLKEIMGEGSLIDALQRMLRQVLTNESLLAADKGRKRENETAISKLRSLTSLLDQRQRRAIVDARINAVFDLTFPLGFIRELPNAIAYFEGDDERLPARQVIGLGKKSGGGVHKRSKLSIRHNAVGRCAEEAQRTTGVNCDKPIGILATMMFGLEGVTASEVEQWRKQWVDGRAYPNPGDNDTLE
jgi:hypothetical protein